MYGVVTHNSKERPAKDRCLSLFRLRQLPNAYAGRSSSYLNQQLYHCCQYQHFNIIARIREESFHILYTRFVSHTSLSHDGLVSGEAHDTQPLEKDDHYRTDGHRLLHIRPKSSIKRDIQHNGTMGSAGYFPRNGPRRNAV